jgi:hypothetical protein
MQHLPDLVVGEGENLGLDMFKLVAVQGAIIQSLVKRIEALEELTIRITCPGGAGA